MKDPAAPHRSQARGGPLQQGRPSDVTLPARGLLFDNDGVLVDSDASVHAAWSRWAETQGLDPDEVTGTVHGRRAADTVALLVPGDQRDRAVALIERLELEDVDRVTPVPGARELVAQLPEGCWAVVTSGTRELAGARLTAAGLPQPAVFVTAEDVSAGKPDPQGYATAAAALGLLPALTLVLEDSASGVRAGLAAGCAVLGVGERALDSDAPVVVRNLVGVRWTGRGLALPADALLRAAHRDR
jgi:mannitol-1-/sugar-/sorbitol-6-phosphatase